MPDIVTIFWLGFTVFLLVVLGTFAIGGLSAAPWVPLWKNDVRRMMRLAKVKPGEILYDLGAGDGRIVLIAAKEFGAKAIGFEIATLPYLVAYIKIKLQGLKAKGQTGQASIRYRNFFKQDFSSADVICAFLTPKAMKKLKPKLEKEIKPGARIVSYAFRIPGWQETLKDKPNKKTTTIYLYQK